jgi:hypothetical protein
MLAPAGDKRCDETTVTQDDIDEGRINIVVGFAPLRPAEFVIITISQIAPPRKASACHLLRTAWPTRASPRLTPPCRVRLPWRRFRDGPRRRGP